MTDRRAHSRRTPPMRKSKIQNPKSKIARVLLAPSVPGAQHQSETHGCQWLRQCESAKSRIENRKSNIIIAALLALWFTPPALAADPPRHIYVPLSDLDAVIDRDRGGVMLTKQEYE